MKRLLGFLGWVGVALVVAAVVLRFSRPDLAAWSQRTALAGLIVTLLYSLSQWRDIARSFGSKNVKYGSIAASSVVVVLGILVGINWVANRQNKQWDLTSGGQFTLSDQTRQLLGSLTKPVTIKAFYAQTSDEVRDRLESYAYVSSQIKTEYVDAVRNPVETRAQGVDTVPTYVIQYEGRTQKANGVDEQALTNALKKVLEGQPKKIYFVIGHGERDPTKGEAENYQTIAGDLKNDNFEVATLALAQTGAIPADANVLVVAGPQVDFLAPEVDILRAWVRKGGKLLLMLDPPVKGTSADQTNLIAFAREWGIDVGKDMIIDASGVGRQVGQGPSVPIAGPLPHPITDPMGNIGSAFPIARTVTPVEGGVEGRTAQKILETSEQSWAEADIAGLVANGQPERNLDKGDKAGPLSLAAAVSVAAPDAPAPPPAAPGAPAPAADAPKPESRVVVVGDADFASTRAINISGNRDLFLNMANWLAQQENLISIRPKSPDNSPISMTEDQMTMVGWFSQIIVPALLLFTGVLVWWRKR
jgi:ABC-type uncharacterized transport system involved in gliding motility auxiliary subunit